MQTKHICVISEGYPFESDSWFSFVEQIVKAFCKNGVRCTVISPQSITKALIRKKKVRPVEWTQHTEYGDIAVYQPYYFSVGSKCPVFLNNIVYDDYIKSVVKIYKKKHLDADRFYGHFWRSGIVAARLARKYNKPAFIACGESTISLFDRITREKYQEDLDRIEGIISVSSENQRECERLGLLRGKKVTVIPNGIDGNSFKVFDKTRARDMIGAKSSDFIVAFVGAFIDRKGPNRVAQAITSVGDDIKSVFIGKGALQPACEGILFKGALKHEDIPIFLNAADIFVLPTLAEGCCNAIIEALACGLPVISSALPFNDDILNDDYSIRVDPTNIEEIATAIKRLKDDPSLRLLMSENARQFAAGLDINNRAQKILDFMNM